MNPNTLPLEDIILPPAISWWPLAWGWWLVLGLSVLVLVLLALAVARWYQRRKQQQQALQQLELLLTKSPSGQRISAFNAWLKLQCQIKQRSVLALHGVAWLDWLNASTATPLFQNSIGQAISQGQYQHTQLEFDSAELLQLGRTWYQQQKVVR